VGITTFLAKVLRANSKFTVRGPRLQSGNSRSGKRIGTLSDRQVEHYVNKGKKYNGNERTTDFFQALRQRDIEPISAKVYVAMPSLKLSTEIDVLGKAKDGSFVVVEQKCTQYTRAQFESMCHLPCVRRHRLSNGMLNTTFNAHQLQTAFSMLALREHTKVPIKGLVVVCFKDGARSYSVESEYVNAALFAGSVKTPRAQLRNFSHLSCKHLDMSGYKSESRLRYGNHVFSRAGEFVVVVLGDKGRTELQADVKKLWLVKKKKFMVRGFLFHVTDGVGVHKKECVATRKAVTTR
jgi:hypothetical protein